MMIKKFKIFEQSISKYKEGDYVFLDLEKLQKDCELGFLDSDDWYIPEDPMFKIIEVSPNSDYPYSGLFYNDNYMNIEEKYILRKMTSEEIKEFELKCSINKYNV